MLSCPACGSEAIKKNGHCENGKQNHCCKKCRRQFVEDPQNKRIKQEDWDLVDRLLLEKIPLAGISRVTKISEPWIQKYVNKKYAEVPQVIDPPESKKKFR
jgi:transposase-like protein